MILHAYVDQTTSNGTLAVQGNHMKSRALIRPFPTPTFIRRKDYRTVGCLCDSLFLIENFIVLPLIHIISRKLRKSCHHYFVFKYLKLIETAVEQILFYH